MDQDNPYPNPCFCFVFNNYSERGACWSIMDHNEIAFYDSFTPFHLDQKAKQINQARLASVGD